MYHAIRKWFRSATKYICLIIIIKSEVSTITHCLGLGHETMVSCPLYVFIYSYSYRFSVQMINQNWLWKKWFRVGNGVEI